jgi:hypothetical protein
MARNTCKVVRTAIGRRRICWGSNGKIKSNTPAGGVGATRGRKRWKKRRKSRRGGSVTSTTVRRNTSTPRKTFKAKKSYAVTGLGKLRKGCKKVKKNGRTEYRCAMPGKKTRKRRRR